jgi:cyclase
VRRVVTAGAGEIIVYAIDRDGTFKGYDLDLLQRAATAADVPVVACGGAAGLDDIRKAVVEGHCSAAAAGSIFVYHSRTRGVLISYPPENALREQVFGHLA